MATASACCISDGCIQLIFSPKPTSAAYSRRHVTAAVAVRSFGGARRVIQQQICDAWCGGSPGVAGGGQTPGRNGPGTRPRSRLSWAFPFLTDALLAFPDLTGRERCG